MFKRTAYKRIHQNLKKKVLGPQALENVDGYPSNSFLKTQRWCYSSAMFYPAKCFLEKQRTTQWDGRDVMLAALTINSILFCLTKGTKWPEGGAHWTTELNGIKTSICEALGNWEYCKTKKFTKVQINFMYLTENFHKVSKRMAARSEKTTSSALRPPTSLPQGPCFSTWPAFPVGTSPAPAQSACLPFSFPPFGLASSLPKAM